MAHRWRGSSNHRGPGRGGLNSLRGFRAASATRSPAPALGSLLATIKKDELLCSDIESDASRPKITNCKVIGSYNWLNRSCPTILIPGSPPAWTPTHTLDRLPQDRGSYFRDQNAARYSAHVFQPALDAILHHDPKFDLHKVDLVACVSTLRNLLQFIVKPCKEFRIIVEAVGSTVFLVRRPNSPTETIESVFGYGHTFPEANTTWSHGVKGSESHQRILQYDFGGLSCAIRYEGDGYLPNVYQPTPPRRETAAMTPKDLLVPFDNSTIGSAVNEEKRDITIEIGGETIPQTAMFDLKTRSTWKRYEDVLRDEIPRLWAAQVPNFVVGFHNKGVFDDVRVEDVRSNIQKWEEEQESSLQKLVALLKALIEFAQGQKEGRFEVVFNRGDELELREIGGEIGCCVSDVSRSRLAENDPDEGGVKLQKDDEAEADEEDGIGEEEEERGRWERESGGWSDTESEKDFTACSASSCGYCGHCGY
ncbi:hypothetical protein BJX99DRAFT_268459 [Aspergillus californicus]